MPTLIIKLAIDAVCGVCFSLGGFAIIWLRRFVMPVILGIAVSLLTHIWWTGLMILPVIGTLVLGYKDFGKGHFSRGCWLFVQALLIGIGCVLTGHLSWIFFVPYCLGAGVLGGLLVSLYQPIGDAIYGCWLGLIVFFIH